MGINTVTVDRIEELLVEQGYDIGGDVDHALSVLQDALDEQTEVEYVPPTEEQIQAVADAIGVDAADVNGYIDCDWGHPAVDYIYEEIEKLCGGAEAHDALLATDPMGPFYKVVELAA
jgi:hypothetical protein